MNYVIYDLDGRIEEYGDCPQDMVLYQGQGRPVVAGSGHWDTHWVERGTDTVTVMPRPDNPAACEGLQLTGLPVPCTVLINGQAYACGQDAVTLDFPHPGKYAVTVRAFPYLDATFEVVK